MELFFEVVLWVALGLIIEPIVFLIIGKVRKDKMPIGKTELNIDPGNFIMKYTKDMKGLTWILACFLGVPIFGIIISFPFIYKSNNLSKTDAIFMVGTFAIMLSIIIYFLIRITLYKIQIVNNEVYIRTIFRTRKFEIDKIDNIKEAASGGARSVIAYINNKKAFKIASSFINFELARKLLLSTKTH